MFNDKILLITGGTGSWGKELVNQILERYRPKEVRIYSRGEHKQVEMRQELSGYPVKFIIGDVRDKDVLSRAMGGADYVFHLAALKHVPVCEENSWEAVLTNIYGTHNVIECAIENCVNTVVDISTDKAVDAFNFYGVTKACGEKLTINSSKLSNNTKFVCIRGGNVMGTNGSVLPLFKKQILEKNEITITEPEMTRFLMSTQEAIGLVFEAVTRSIGGEIFVMKMPSTKVYNIASVMINLFGNADTKIRNIGSRPGEKMHEVLVSKNEAPYTKSFNERYYVILPQYKSELLERAYAKYVPMEYNEFNSNNTRKLTDDEFIKILRKEKWLW